MAATTTQQSKRRRTQAKETESGQPASFGRPPAALAARLMRKPPPVERATSVRLTEDMHRAAAIEAAESQCSVSDVLRTAILTYLIAYQPAEFVQALEDIDGP